MRMHENETLVDEALVRRLIAAQMPHLADRPIWRVEPWGTDNAIWRLGDDLVVRLPRIEWAVQQVAKEEHWLPVIDRYVSIDVPEPVAVGAPGEGYPYPWAVHRWITGEPAAPDTIGDPVASRSLSPTSSGACTTCRSQAHPLRRIAHGRSPSTTGRRGGRSTPRGI